MNSRRILTFAMAILLLLPGTVSAQEAKSHVMIVGTAWDVMSF